MTHHNATNYDLFKDFLNLSESILITIQRRQHDFQKEIHWLNQHFLCLIHQLRDLKDTEYKTSLLNMAISELVLLKEYNDDDDKVFDFIELVINLKNKV